MWSFLKAQYEFSGFYNMYSVMQDNFEYPPNQHLIYYYQNSFVRVGNIIKDDDGGLQEFSLSLIRNWLPELQDAYDQDNDDEGWTKEASDDGNLAYNLLVQTGDVNYPVDKSLSDWSLAMASSTPPPSTTTLSSSSEPCPPSSSSLL